MLERLHPTAPRSPGSLLGGGGGRHMSLFDFVFGCSHQRCSFPITVKSKLRRSAAAAVTGTYVGCLDCGKEFAYDWKAMKMVRSASGGSATPGPIAVAPGSKAA